MVAARHPHISACRLPAGRSVPILPGMFAITDTDAAAVRAAFERSGALAAAAEMRRLFPGLSAAGAHAAAQMIIPWQHPPQDGGGASDQRK